MIANLIEKKWLRREFHVVTNDGVFSVIYDGRGLGYEEILVNGEVARRTKSFWWYVPRFDFMIGNAEARVDVRVSPLLQISALDLTVGDSLIYTE